MDRFDQAVIDGIGQMMSALPRSWLAFGNYHYHVDTCTEHTARFPFGSGRYSAPMQRRPTPILNGPPFAHREAGFDALHSLYHSQLLQSNVATRRCRPCLVVFVSDEEEQRASQFSSTNALVFKSLFSGMVTRDSLSSWRAL